MSEEKLKIVIDIVKWIIGSVVLVIVTTIIDTGFKEREMAIKEMAKFDSYIDMVTSADKLVERKRLAQFFKTMTISKDVQARWSDYYEIVSKEYDDTLAVRVAKQDTLNLLLKKPMKNETDSQKIQQIQQDINGLNYQLISNISPTNAVQIKNINIATAHEQVGYEALKDGDFKTAADNFKAAEDNYPTLHNNYELSRLLAKKSDELSKAVTEEEKQNILAATYDTILKNYTYKMPLDVKQNLKRKIK
ncbi:MAG: hypothetical protein ABI723_15480 [Bacteroidia bacterium]